MQDQGRLRMRTVSCGHSFLRFTSHREAMIAARRFTDVEMTPGLVLDVAWADPKEWSKAAPRLPTYF